MNILSLNPFIQKQAIPQFQGKSKLPKGSGLKQLSSDVVELMPKLPNSLPQKFELTEAEKSYNEVLKQLHTLNMNIHAQKSNLHDFYSAQDRMDYRELLKERRKVQTKLKQIANKSGLPQDVLEMNVAVKKEYNRYAPKIARANSMEELHDVENLLSGVNLFVRSEELLFGLISQQRKMLKK